MSYSSFSHINYNSDNDIIYQLINIENFTIHPDKLHNIICEIQNIHNLEKPHLLLEYTRAILLAEQFNNLESSVNDSSTDSEFDFNETESEIDSDDEAEMENDMQFQDELEKKVKPLDNWLSEHTYLLPYLDDNFITTIYSQLQDNTITHTEALNHLFQHKHSIILEHPDYTPDDLWLREIKSEQEKTDLCLNTINFENLVREMVHNYTPHIIDFEPTVFTMLQTISESFLIETFQHANIKAISVNRHEIQPKDLH
uniref:Core Histone H2A/H2B/H3 domain-containing protein n=1 Tax=viral metagenome TaxID=1070528 RepID=A0A6C0F5X3_9ZZZZ|tara:strand:- start:1939 stop:2706 length:768 start_codon:yes stop_codon:yes gene_type:complete